MRRLLAHRPRTARRSRRPFGLGLSLALAGAAVIVPLTGPAAAAAAPSLTITPTAVGNAFTVGQQVKLGFATNASTLNWTVRDAAGTEVAGGSAPATSLNGQLALDIDTAGWYQVDLRAVVADGTTTTGGTDFSVLTPHDFSTSTDTRIGAAAGLGRAGTVNPGLNSVPLMAMGGLSTARDEAYWSAAETTPGVIEFPQAVKNYKAALDANNIDFLNILDYGNPLYYPDEAPSTDDQRAAFARYAVAAVDEFGTAHTTYEVWNEWNHRDLDGPAGGTADSYVALLRTTVTAIRAKHPDARIVGPALAIVGDWQNWFSRFADLGGLAYVDAVSIHPYVYPTDAEAALAYVDTIRDIITAHGADTPIHISEQGWATGTNPKAVSEFAQARNLVRGQLTSFADGVERYAIYNFMDAGTNPSDVEHRFGLVRNVGDARGALVPKPSYVATAVLARQIDELPLIGQTTFGTGGRDVAFNVGDGTSVHALWSTTPGLVSVAAPAGSTVEVTNFYGATTTLTADPGGHVWVSTGPDPVYLQGRIGAVAASSRFGLAVAPEIAGDPAGGTVTFTNPDPTAYDFTVAAGGAVTSGRAPAGGKGSATVRYPAQSSTGPRSYPATVTVGGRAVALLTTSGTASAPLTVQGSHALAADGRDVLRLRVGNTSSRSVTIAGLDWAAGSASGTVLAGTSVVAHAATSVDVPLTLTASTTWSASLRVSGRDPVRASGRLNPVTAPTEAPEHAVTLDGTIDPQLSLLTPSSLVGTGTPPVNQWGGPDDLSGSLWLTHDDNDLYLSARITDNVHSQPNRNDAIWGGDSLQIGITAGAPGEATRTQEIGVARTDAGTVDVYRWLPTDVSNQPPGVRARVVRDAAAHTTTYEIAIPWTTLGIDRDDRLISSTVVVNENDAAGRRGWLTWGTGVAEAKNPAGYNAVRLDSAPAAAPGSTDAAFGVTTTVRPQCWSGDAVLPAYAGNNEQRGPLVHWIRTGRTRGEGNSRDLVPAHCAATTQ